ncbi:hypothetical protein DPMN_038969 [Dreissena polymorpha]|uniref:Uncharacterized protein n=1 Tax=Dreissena polymorpha TaxID=45954 RepID=A0A9D4MHC7_DREPO|nr:hypothetical protein DPMN_038969 [Dreissena polymorpha]
MMMWPFKLQQRLSCEMCTITGKENLRKHVLKIWKRLCRTFVQNGLPMQLTQSQNLFRSLWKN